ncbi:MAG: site-2 protease family protein [Leptolinea sp.]|jgi:membrane-associated protease RseP (regulator of RpoE activity)|nr:site-2 protease family protein [Leptolinea sp.]
MSITTNNEEIIRNYVERILSIDDITTGEQKDGFLLRFRGHLRSENSEEAYSLLENQIRPFNLTPLFRKEANQHTILIVEGVPIPRQSNPWINLLLFVLTAISVLITGAMYGTDQLFTGGFWQSIKDVIYYGWPFAISMLAILAAHEFGHYFMGRHYGIHVTLPYFIPFPLSPFGTLGAFINMKEIPKNRRQLLDIGLAGPLAGLVVAVPVLFIGLRLSALNVLPATPPSGQMLQMEGNSLLYLLIKFLSFGQLLPAPASYTNTNPILYWIGYFFTARPYPVGGMDVMLHPVAWAGWAGMLVTALNLIPAGQLDGGHTIYVLLGKEKSMKLRVIVLVILIALGFVWSGWWLWAAIIYFLGRYYAEPLDQITELDGNRKILAAVGLVIFLLVFTPVPLSLIG